MHSLTQRNKSNYIPKIGNKVLTFLFVLSDEEAHELTNIDTLFTYSNVKMDYEDFKKFKNTIIHSRNNPGERPIWLRLAIPDEHIRYFKNTYPEYLL